MPPTSDTRYPHLHLVREEPNLERRKRPFSGQKPDRGSRETFGHRLNAQVIRLEGEAKQQPPPIRGIHPHLVFRIPVIKSVSTNEIVKSLNDVDIDVVSIEAENAIIAFHDDTSLDKFRQAINEYQSGPRSGINPSTGKPYQHF